MPLRSLMQAERFMGGMDRGGGMFGLADRMMGEAGRLLGAQI